jgi:hypothetical protein
LSKTHHNSNIQQSILRTLAFYDLFEFPLTNLEIIDNLYQCEASTDDILSAIKDLASQGKIGFQDGFYFLAQHDRYVPIRKERYLATFKKWHLINKEKYLFRLSPFIKMIGIANTLAYSNAKADGDIDLLVVAAAGRLFTTRLFLTFWLVIFGRWRHGRNIKNRYCLSFFVTDDHLDLQSLHFPDSDDIYLTFWTKWLKPWYCTNSEIANQYFVKNQWIKKYLPNTVFANTCYQKDAPGALARFFEILLQGPLGDLLEKLLRYFMTAKIRRTHPHDDIDGIVVSDKMLKFHPAGKRKDYQQKWQSLIEKTLFDLCHSRTESPSRALRHRESM